MDAHSEEFEQAAMADPRMRAIMEALQAASVLANDAAALDAILPRKHTLDVMASIAAPAMEDAFRGQLGPATERVVLDVVVRSCAVAFLAGVSLGRREER